MQGDLLAETYRLQGEVLLRRGKGAEECFRKALDIARRQQAKSWELRAAMSLSRLWQQQGKRDEARELLPPIYGWFTEGFDTADLREATPTHRRDCVSHGRDGLDKPCRIGYGRSTSRGGRTGSGTRVLHRAMRRRVNMKAVRVHTPGGPEGMVYEDVADAKAGAGQAVVKVEAIGLNFAEVNQRRNANAGAHLLPEAGATQERGLEAVRCSALFGLEPRRRPWTGPLP